MLSDKDHKAILRAAHALPGRLGAHERVRMTTALCAWKRLDDCFRENVVRRGEAGLPEPANLHWHSFIVPPGAAFPDATDAQGAFRLLAHWNPCLQGHAEVLAPALSGPELDAARAPLLPLDFGESAQEYPDVAGLAFEAVKQEYLRPRNDRGEYFTPCSLVRHLMVPVLDPRAGTKIHEPACGSGRMLVEAARYVREKSDWTGLLPPPLAMLAQDVQPFMAALTQINLLAMGYANAVCVARNTLTDPVTPAEAHRILAERQRAMIALRLATPLPRA